MTLVDSLVAEPPSGVLRRLSVSSPSSALLVCRSLISSLKSEEETFERTEKMQSSNAVTKMPPAVGSPSPSVARGKDSTLLAHVEGSLSSGEAEAGDDTMLAAMIASMSNKNEAFMEGWENHADLVQRETPSWRFIQSEKGNVERAAARMAAYWENRKTYFGERAFLPMVLGGEGALSEEDSMVLMDTGFITFLPKRADGSPVLYFDRSGLEKAIRVDERRLQCIFYLFHIASQDPAAQSVGVTILRYMQGESLRLNIPHFSSLVKQMPFVVKSIDLVLHPPAEANRTAISNIAPDILKSFDDDLNETVRIHVSMKSHELAEKLSKHGFSSCGLPYRMGGTARLRPLMTWLEGKSPVAAPVAAPAAAPAAKAQINPIPLKEGSVAAKSHRQRVREKANLEYLKITSDNLKHKNRIMKQEAARLEILLGAAHKEVDNFFRVVPPQGRIFTIPPIQTQPHVMVAHAPSPFVQGMPGFDSRLPAAVAPARMTSAETALLLHQRMGQPQVYPAGATISHFAGPGQLLHARPQAAPSFLPYQYSMPAAEDPRRTAYLQLIAQDRLVQQQRQQSELATILSRIHENR
jgi:hypothetical protein